MNRRSRGALIPLAIMALLMQNDLSARASDGDADAPSPPVLRAVGEPTPDWERYTTLHFILERTFLKVDAVKVDMRVDEETAQALRPLVEGREKYTDDLADSVAAVLLNTRYADIDLEFLVSFSLKKFLKGTRKNIEGVAKAGLLSKEDADMIADEQPDRFAFLSDRGMKDGDQLFYAVRGDTVNTTFIYLDGTIGLEETNVGPVRRISLLGAYLGPRSDFRKGLITSLYEE